MPALLTEVDARYDDILFNARGIDAMFSAAAQAVAIPIASLRPAPAGADLRGGGIEANEFDRCSYREWLTSRPLDGPRNSYDGSQLRRCRFNELVGLVFGPAREGVVMQGSGTEFATESVQYVRRRAISLGEQIAAAYEFSEIAGNDTDPAIVDTRLADDGISVEGIGAGKLLLVVSFECWLERRGGYRP